MNVGDPDYSSLKFLIVDDAAFMLDLLESTLRRCKAGDIKRCNNGKDAIEVLRVNPNYFDLVISDCNMKPINGLQFLRTVREGKVAPVPKDLPVIFVSGHNDAPIVERAIELNINGFLAKPVSFEKLVSTINMVIQKSKLS